jgi:hypothetical protein
VDVTVIGMPVMTVFMVLHFARWPVNGRWPPKPGVAEQQDTPLSMAGLRAAAL